MTYLGYDVFERVPLHSKQDNSMGNDYLLVGEERKKQEKIVYTPSQREFKWSYFAASLSDARELREFFRQKVGRLTPFWLPSFKNDIVLTSSASGGVSVLTAKNSQRKYSLLNIKRHICVRSLGYAAQIVGAAIVEGDYEFGNETIAISKPLPQPIAAGKAQMPIEYLFFVRLNSDEFRLEKYGKASYAVTFSFQELQRETSDIGGI